MKRRSSLLLLAMLSLLLLGARTRKISVLPPTVQSGFEQVMREVNQKHALGTSMRITDVRIQKRQVVMQFDYKGKGLELRLVHREAEPRAVESRYFSFSYDEKSWRGRHAELVQLASLLDKAFPRTPWFIAVSRETPFHLLQGWVNMELPPRLAMTLFASSWLIGLAGVALLLRRRTRR